MKKKIISIALVAVLAGTVGYRIGAHEKEQASNKAYWNGYDKGRVTTLELEASDLEEGIQRLYYSKGYNKGFYDGYHYDVRTEDYGEFEDYAERYPKK